MTLSQYKSSAPPRRYNLHKKKTPSRYSPWDYQQKNKKIVQAEEDEGEQDKELDGAEGEDEEEAGEAPPRTKGRAKLPVRRLRSYDEEEEGQPRRSQRNKGHK